MALSTSYFVLYFFIWFFTIYSALHSLFGSSISRYLFETFFSHFIKLTTFQPIVRKRIDFLGISHFSVCLTEKEKKREICSFCFVLNQLIDLNPLPYFIIYFVFTFRCTKCRVFFTLAFGWQRFHFMLNNRIFSLPLHYFTLLLVFFSSLRHPSNTMDIQIVVKLDNLSFLNACSIDRFDQSSFFSSVVAT